MTKEMILKELQPVFREVFMDDTLEITADTTAFDIEDWDSLMQIVLVSAMEKKYDLSFSIDEVSELKNVGDMADMILRGLHGSK